VSVDISYSSMDSIESHLIVRIINLHVGTCGSSNLSSLEGCGFLTSVSKSALSFRASSSVFSITTKRLEIDERIEKDDQGRASAFVFHWDGLFKTEYV